MLILKYIYFEDEYKNWLYLCRISNENSIYKCGQNVHVYILLLFFYTGFTENREHIKAKEWVGEGENEYNHNGGWKTG